ncbi:MAG: hypothetical protein QOC65_555 [Sphingomonadales bacterium]|nr:hypothetical protein [Sphingomonadales bacterium]
MTKQRRRYRYAAIGAAAALVLFSLPTRSQMQTESRVDDLCRERGGLHVREDIPLDAVFTEVSSALFAAGDPVASIARHGLVDNVAVAGWDGHLEGPTLPCMQSGECAGVLLTRSRRAYMHIESNARFLISMERSPYCGAEVSPGEMPRQLAATAADYARILQQRPVVCRAAPVASTRLYVIPPQALSAPNSSALNRMVFRAWRVFREGRRDAVIEYNQFGIEALGKRLSRVGGLALGVTPTDQSGNRCRVNPRLHPGIPSNANSHFDLDAHYPTGSFVDQGTDP